MKRLFLLLSLMLSFIASSEALLIVDVSNPVVVKDSSFKGMNIYLTGIADTKSEMMVEVIGPEMESKLWKRVNKYGIWIKKTAIKSVKIPSYYHYAVHNNDASEGFERLIKKRCLDAIEDPAYATSTLDILQQRGLYPKQPDAVEFVSNHIFKTSFYLPEHAETGTYEVTTCKLGADNECNHTSFTVERSQFRNKIVALSKSNKILYAVLAVLLALALGGLAGYVFRKDMK
jgi:hypothetical protein